MGEMNDSRYNTKEIVAATGLPMETVRYRIRRLQLTNKVRWGLEYTDVKRIIAYQGNTCYRVNPANVDALRESLKKDGFVG